MIGGGHFFLFWVCMPRLIDWSLCSGCFSLVAVCRLHSDKVDKPQNGVFMCTYTRIRIYVCFDGFRGVVGFVLILWGPTWFICASTWHVILLTHCGNIAGCNATQFRCPAQTVPNSGSVSSLRARKHSRRKWRNLCTKTAQIRPILP